MSAQPLGELVFDRHDGQGPAIVLLHGLTQQRRFWQPVVGRLRDSAHPLPVIAVDQRGHGDSPKPVGGPYDIEVCADDVAALLDRQGVSGAVLVGHSWGGWVAVSLAASRPDLVAGLVCLDGGFTRLSDLGERSAVRERLTPPALAMTLDELRTLIAQGDLAPWWSDELWEALRPTFEVDDDGRVRTRLGLERHMQVLDGALDFDPVPSLERITCPTWLVRCAPLAGSGDEAWRRAGEAALARAEAVLAQPRVLRWSGALHDVPLQWPWLVAGLLRACADEIAAGDAGRVREVVS